MTYSTVVKQLLDLVLYISLLHLAELILPVFRWLQQLINQINSMILLSTWRQAWFILEYILKLVAQLRILGLYTILPSGLTHNRPDQSTPRQTLRITMYQIYECFCQCNVHFNAFSHLLSDDNNLLLTQHAITTFTHATAVKTRHRLCYIIFA